MSISRSHQPSAAVTSALEGIVRSVVRAPAVFLQVVDDALRLRDEACRKYPDLRD